MSYGQMPIPTPSGDDDRRPVRADWPDDMKTGTADAGHTPAMRHMDLLHEGGTTLFPERVKIGHVSQKSPHVRPPSSMAPLHGPGQDCCRKE